MPSWTEVINAIEVIKGDAKEVFDSIRSADSLLDFNQLIPMPKDIEASDADAREHWSVENWGSKSNSIDAKAYGNDPLQPVEILFRTVRTRPEPVFEALARKFPRHELVMHSDEYESGMDDRHFTFTAKDGQLTKTEDPCECAELPSFEEMLGVADDVVVGRLRDCSPPEFLVTARLKGNHPILWQQRFPSIAAAWDAIEAVSSFKRSIQKPDQDVIDNTRFPVDVECGGENGTRSQA